MNKRKKQQAIVLSFFFTSFFMCLCSCNVNGSEASESKSFDYDLRGKWVSNEQSLYSGILKIDSDTITIDGYEENYWLVTLGDDNKRPFKDFPRRVALKGYSEDGKIFIKKGDSVQNGITYTYYVTENYPKVKILEFVFGGRMEILQCTDGP